MATSERERLERTLGPDRPLVALQILLESALLIGAVVEFLLFGSGYTLLDVLVNIAVGLVLVVVGLVIASKAKRDLARNFTTSPTPVPDGSLVETGIYGRMRHPMYLGVLLVSYGWAVLWGSWFALVGSLVMNAFLLYKSRREDRLLMGRYPGYAEYKRRVPGGIVPR